MSRLFLCLIAPVFLLLACSYAPSGSYRDYQIREMSLEVDTLSTNNMCTSLNGQNQIPYARWQNPPDGVESFILFMESSMSPPTTSWECSAGNDKVLEIKNVPTL